MTFTAPFLYVKPNWHVGARSLLLAPCGPAGTAIPAVPAEPVPLSARGSGPMRPTPQRGSTTKLPRPCASVSPSGWSLPLHLHGSSQANLAGLSREGRRPEGPQCLATNGSFTFGFRSDTRPYA